MAAGEVVVDIEKDPVESEVRPDPQPLQAPTPTPQNSEKQTTFSIDPAHSGVATPGSSHGNHPNAHQARERLRHFLHPDGKRIHVAGSPEEAGHLRTRLGSLYAAHEYEVTISGTPEHLEHLRSAQNHHQDARDRLREQHPAVYNQFDEIHAELNALASELDRVTTHGLALGAHFDRFGYNAHVKSYDNDNESPGVGARSSRTSISSGDTTLVGSTAPYERGFATQLKLFKVPTLRQYFHKGILWRAKESVEVQSFELFVDLLYVGILQILGDHAAEHPSGTALVHLFITFTLAWKIWIDMSLVISWFETDDILQRFVVLFLLACLFGYTTSTTEAFSDGGTYATLIGYYLAARLAMAIYMLVIAYFIPMIRPVMLCHSTIALGGAALWVGSCHISYPAKYALIFVAMWIDLIVPIFIVMLRVNLGLIAGQRGKDWFDRKFEFIPAINIEHRTERTNAFVSLVFGFSVVALLYQAAHNGITRFYGKAILGLIQIFCFNWIYFEIDASNLHLHAIRRSKLSSLVWSFAHLPFILSFVLAGGGLAKIVIAYDTTSAHLEDLTSRYADAAESEHLNALPMGLKWFYCAGLGTALLLMALISISHIHREHKHTRLVKRKRLRIRAVVAILLITMPLYMSREVSSVQLVAIVTGLIVFLLMCELTASSDSDIRVCGRDQACRYTGRCSKGQLLEIVKSGKRVSLDGLAALARDPGRHRGHAVQP